jgi:hypothetical protein
MKVVFEVTPIDIFRCPKCGLSVVWSVSSGAGKQGEAHCSNGKMASMMGLPTSLCSWTGCCIIRLYDDDVYVVSELKSRTMTLEKRVRLLFELGRANVLSNTDSFNFHKISLCKDSNPHYKRGCEQGLAELRARKADEMKGAKS